MSNSSRSSGNSNYKPKSSKKLPKDPARSEIEVNFNENLQSELEKVQLQLAAMKAKVETEDDLQPNRYPKLSQQDKDCFLQALDSFSSDLKSKVDLVKNLWPLGEDKPAQNIDSEDLIKSANSLGAAKLIVDHMVINKSEQNAGKL